MNAVELLDRLEALGVAIEVHGDKLRLTPGSLVPPDLVDSLRVNKAALLAHLRYRQKYPGDGVPGDVELREIEERVYVDGYVLLWSTALQDLIAFYKTEADRKKIPPGFTPYSHRELRELFGATGPSPSASHLRLVHQAKKLGAGVMPHTDRKADGGA